MSECPSGSDQTDQISDYRWESNDQIKVRITSDNPSCRNDDNPVLVNAAYQSGLACEAITLSCVWLNHSLSEILSRSHWW